MADKIMGKKRESRNRDLERYVIRDARGYVRYKHPQMDKPQHFGTDVKAANEVARIVNAKLSSQAEIVRRIIDPENPITFNEVANRFEALYVPTLKWSDNYTRENLGRLRILRTALGESSFQSLDVLQVSEAIDNYFKGDGRRLARNVLIHLYRFAKGKGLRKGSNIGEEVLQSASSSRKRRRIANYAEFERIRAAAPDFLQDAMDLSLLTLQGRQELISMRLKHDKGELLQVIRQKTAEHTDTAYIEIEIGPELRALLHRCKVKAMRYGSPFVLNHAVKGHHRSEKKEHRTQILPRYLSESFRKAVIACGLYDHLADDERPSLHEVRSLGARIYRGLGVEEEDIQKLMGHSKLATTEGYLEGDQIAWTRARATLDFKSAALAKVKE